MFASDNTPAAHTSLPRSGKGYKRDFKSYSLGQDTAPSPINSEDSDPEDNPSFGNPPVTPQRSSVTPEIPSQSDCQPSPSIPTTGQSASVKPPPSTSCPPPNPPKTAMAHLADDIKLPIFKGTGSEDPEQFWFLCEAVWNVKKITDPDVRAAQLITSFRDTDLT